jgi:hypothetical protein
VNKCNSLHIPSFKQFINYMNSLYSEVFKARVKNTDNFVALKKVLVLNEKEGVSGSLQ